MQNFQLTTIILWGALHSEGGPWPPAPPNQGGPPGHPQNPPPQPLAPQQPPTPVLPAPWQMQPWTQNQEPTQLTWTAQHHTPQGLVTSWGGYTTHAINTPQAFAPPQAAPQQHGQPYVIPPHFPPQASLPAQPQQQPTAQPSSFQRPPPSLSTHPRHTAAPGEQPRQSRPPAGRPPQRSEPTTGTVTPGITHKMTQTLHARSLASRRRATTCHTPRRGSPPQGRGHSPKCSSPSIPSGSPVADFHKHTWTGYAHNNPPTRPSGEPHHRSLPRQSSTSPKAALHRRSNPWNHSHPTTHGDSEPPSCRSSPNHHHPLPLSQPRPLTRTSASPQKPKPKPPIRNPPPALLPRKTPPQPTPTPQRTMTTPIHSPPKNPKPQSKPAMLESPLGSGPTGGGSGGTHPPHNVATPSGVTLPVEQATVASALAINWANTILSSAPSLDTDQDIRGHNPKQAQAGASRPNVQQRGTPLPPPAPMQAPNKPQQPKRSTTSAAGSLLTNGGSENTETESNKTRQQPSRPPPRDHTPRHRGTRAHREHPQRAQ